MNNMDIIKRFLSQIKSLIKETMKSIWIYLSPLSCVSYYIKSGKYKTLTVWGGDSFYHLMDNAFEYYLTETERKDEVLKNELLQDMLMCFFLYGANPEEYMIHGFREKNKEEREAYLPKQQKDFAIMKQLGSNCDKAFIDLKDKFAFYKIAGQFFKRDAFSLKNNDDFDDFRNFVANHNIFIAKPIKGRYGLNTAIYKLADYASGEALFNKLLSISDEWILEELIEQDERMKEWNPTSVNTIRISSFRTTGGVKILAPFLRMGRKGSVVDNAGSGGVFVSVDAATGTICSDGLDELGKAYKVNPDNGKVFQGWVCPEWKELLVLAEEVHKSLPEYHKYVGFDFALSTEGWVLVEGNWGDFICQQSTLKRGLKKEFLDLLNA